MRLAQVVRYAAVASTVAACHADHRAGPDAASPDTGGGADAAATIHGLQPVDGGQIVYDHNQNVYWLANANLAGDATIRAELGATGLPINPNGTMDYATAKLWVQLLDSYQNGAGYLGHHDWQLPVTPPTDPSCAVLAGNGGNSFGPSCTGSALGNLYSMGFALTYPDSPLPMLASSVGPFVNLQPSFYLSGTASPDGTSDDTFTFATGLRFKNTTKYNYFPVLPMIAGAIGTAPVGSGLVPYTSGPAAGLAVWDSATGTTWLRDADFARSNNLGLTGTTTVPTHQGSLTIPLVDASGSMLLSTAQTWVGALDTMQYAGTSASGAGAWTLPGITDLVGLYSDLGLVQGDPRMLSTASVGPFQNLQPFFYWSCERDQSGASTSPCNGMDAGSNAGGTTMDFSFDFESGFQGTDEDTKQFYVMVYYPGA